MKRVLFYLCFVFFFAATAVKGKCKKYNQRCRSNEQCCAISNGKSYCNFKTNRCEAWRYCDESDDFKCPFDDLSKDELEKGISLIRNSGLFSPDIQWPIVRKQEPDKKLWNSGHWTGRKRMMFAAVFDLRNHTLYEVKICLTTGKIESVEEKEEMIPPIMKSDYEIANEVALGDPRIAKAFERRGLNLSHAHFDMWAVGEHVPGSNKGQRRVKLVANYKPPGTLIADWRPIEGLTGTIDIEDEKLIEFTDIGDVPVPKPPYFPEIDNSMTKSHANWYRKSAIKIKGYVVKWHGWRLQYSMDTAHGLQFYGITFRSDCEERPLIYHLAFTEMYVPYGAHGKTWRWRGAFDAGEYGMGKNASPLKRGRDVPMTAKMLPCQKVDDNTGEVTVMEGCIAIYERDDSPLLKHYHETVKAAKAGAEMVIAYMCTIGNYDYIIDHVFTMDGNIEVSLAATGILLARAVPNRINDPNCVEDCKDYINYHTIAPVHQHFFNYKIDFDIDGVDNSLLEVEFTRDPLGPDNEDGGAFSLHRTLIRNETFRDMSHQNARYWTVINTQSRNNYNSPRGFSIHPHSAGHTFLLPGSALNSSMFITHPIWATAYNVDEQEASGRYPRSGIPQQGLPTFIENSESLDNEDVVLWHTFVVNHPPRPEEFPIMNKMRCGFCLLSTNFQSSNPNLQNCEKETKPKNPIY